MGEGMFVMKAAELKKKADPIDEKTAWLEVN
jgi:hypothetical protein